jgi:hypothetical protein
MFQQLQHLLQRLLERVLKCWRHTSLMLVRERLELMRLRLLMLLLMQMVRDLVRANQIHCGHR